MTKLKLGIIGGGYMGKRHAAAFSAVGAVFETTLRPHLSVVCATSEASSTKYRDAYGFDSATTDWREIVNDSTIDAVIIASPQDTHEEIALAALSAGKHVLCEKPLSTSVQSGARMAQAAAASGKVAMAGFNYIRTPVTQAAIKMINDGVLGQLTGFRAEHTEDFLSDPQMPANWRCHGRENGTMGDLSPHIIHNAMTLIGPIQEVFADIETVHKHRGGAPVTNDDQANILCRFEGGLMGSLHVSRIATGRKMGYCYEVTGTKGALRFDQEDQNALWYYDASQPLDLQGFRKILAGPAHPDYWAFCDGPGHGTGYGDQIVMQAFAFLEAIEGKRAAWPSFDDGLMVDRVVDACFGSMEKRGWQAVVSG